MELYYGAVGLLVGKSEISAKNFNDLTGRRPPDG
jgi:hypothetical protein